MKTPAFVLAAAFTLSTFAAEPTLEAGFRAPPPAARPHTYWLWLNGHVDLPTAADELKAMRDAGLGGVLLFEMGARGDPATTPPPGPAFLSADWLQNLRATTEQARALGLQVDMSVISSWDMGGPWIEPKHAVMGLYSTETTATVAAGTPLDLALPFPTPERAAPLGADGRPAFWIDVAVLALRTPRRLPAHEFVLRLEPVGIHDLAAVVLDQGRPNAPAALAATMTPVREFSVAVSTTGTDDRDFTEVHHGALAATAGPQRFALPAGTRATYVRLRLISGHDDTRPRWTLGEFEVLDGAGRNLAASHRVDQARGGALLVREPVPLTFTAWSAGKLHDGLREGAGGVFATAGRPSFDIADLKDVVDVTAHVDRDGRLRWAAPPGQWTLLRYVCMVTGEKLKVPSPSSDGLASDHLNPDATRLHMDHVIARLRAGLGQDLSRSGLENLYLASYEVVGRVWSPVFAGEFKRRRGYDLTPFLPTIFGARIGGEATTARFLFDYRKTLGEVVVDAYYRTAAEVARAAGLKIKSEAGGPGPPIHTPPIESLSAYGAIDSIQGEFWPFWPDNDAINVIKEPASAAHIYGKSRVHLEAFTSFHHWAEGPQDLKPSADRVFTEGGNHFAWHTWTHQAPDYGLPGLVYGAGTHLSRSVTWWPKAKPFLDYLARGSFLLQRGHFVADVLYYYGDAGMNFVLPRKNPATLGPGYDYDVTNAEVLLNRFTVRNGRLTLPEGTSYALLVLPDRDDIHPPVLEKIESLVAAGATVLGRRPTRASGLEGFPVSDARVRELAAKLWGDLDGRTRTSRTHGRGRVFTGVTARAVLTALGVAPDFTAPATLDFTHRRDGEDEIYFVRNKTAAPVAETATFRAGDRTPELWDAISGRIARAPAFRRTAAGIEVPLTLAPHGSIFVIFRARSTAAPLPVTSENAPGLPAPLALDRDWTIDFASPLGAPARVTQPEVGPWTATGSAEHRYFSGTGTYRKTFTLPAGWRAPGRRIALDLGRLWTIGEVFLNGKSLGVLWTPPFRVDCTEALRNGENELIVEVINPWQNRLVGEARDAIPRRTRTNILVSQRKPWKDLEPLASGLFGPVRLVPSQTITP
ncbi:MAG: glycosyl hydrolase [Opitutaceae bacterium]|nr:glycosyl hydrolase [Opitutaceae bacterium]